MQIIEIITQARNAINEKGQFTNEQLVGFINRGISEINATLSVNFPLIPQPYNLQLGKSLQELPVTMTSGVVYPYALFNDDLQTSTLVNYVAYAILLSKKDEYNMVYRNAFDMGVQQLIANFTFDYTNKYRSRLKKFSFITEV